jgi:hypothetical protein
MTLSRPCAQVALSKGQMFEDSNLEPGQAALYTRYDHTPQGLLPAAAVRHTRVLRLVRVHQQ